MKTNTVCLFLFGSLLSISGMAQPGKDSTQVKRNYTIDEVVVTGTRNETDIRHLPMTISVVGRQQIEKRYEPSLLPLLTEQVPGFFTTSRGIMGYGVSTGCLLYTSFTTELFPQNITMYYRVFSICTCAMEIIKSTNTLFKSD